MTHTLIATLAGLGLALLVAWGLGGGLEGPRPAGVMSGYLFGASVGVLGVSYQRHVLRTAPGSLMSAMVVGFGFKLAGLFVAALVLLFVEPVARVLDARSFILAYAAAALLSLVFGSRDNARMMREESAA